MLIGARQRDARQLLRRVAVEDPLGGVARTDQPSRCHTRARDPADRVMWFCAENIYQGCAKRIRAMCVPAVGAARRLNHCAPGGIAGAVIRKLWLSLGEAA